MYQYLLRDVLQMILFLIESLSQQQPPHEYVAPPARLLTVTLLPHCKTAWPTAEQDLATSPLSYCYTVWYLDH
jgi:hypothetical protein